MNNYTMRTYSPSDYDMLCGWWYAHGKPSRPEIFLPKCGVVCEFNGNPIAALFLYMDNSCGMCMADNAVSAPKLPLKQALIAFRHCISCLKNIAAGFGYHTIAVFTTKGIAKVLKKQGFETTNTNLQMLCSLTKENENG